MKKGSGDEKGSSRDDAVAKKPPGCETPERERDGHPGIDRNLQEALELGLRRRGRVARQANSRAVGLVAGPKTTCVTEH